jgi:hypothetical protein
MLLENIFLGATVFGLLLLLLLVAVLGRPLRRRLESPPLVYKEDCEEELPDEESFVPEVRYNTELEHKSMAYIDTVCNDHNQFERTFIHPDSANEVTTHIL